MDKRILFISTLNLSMNPRILKEIKLAHSLNYDISFLGFNLGNWSDKLDEEIRKGMIYPKYRYLDASRSHYFQWLKHSFLERINGFIWKLNKGSVYLAATASSKRTFSLLEDGKKVRPGDFDLVIGHTLGSFYPATKIAHQAQCGYAFDVEDFHPGEYMGKDKENETKRRELIMKRTFGNAKYISVSSPLIGKVTGKLCDLDNAKIIPVLNYFDANEFVPPIVIEGNKIKMVWFSQFISSGRGLEIILSEWGDLKEYCELTFIGNPGNDLNGSMQPGINIIPPMSQSELHVQLSRYDIGLALDLTDRDINRDIALTNKILAYYQAGLYILGTDTAAQTDFINQHPGSGILFSQTEGGAFKKAMAEIRNRIGEIRTNALKGIRRHLGTAGFTSRKN